MIIDKSEHAVLAQFRYDWRSIGWWAEANMQTYPVCQFSAALFSPTRLREMIEEGYKDDVDAWNRSSSLFKSEVPPELLEYPSHRYMDDISWSVGDTAIRACGGAIVIAKMLYPLEMSSVAIQTFSISG